MCSAHSKVGVGDPRPFVDKGQYSFGVSRNLVNQVGCIITALALTAIAGVAAYFCLTNGFFYLDTAMTLGMEFGGGFLMYMGAVFSFVAVGNLLYGAGRLFKHQVCDDGQGEFNYSKKEISTQIFVSVFAPVAVVPVVICCLSVAVAGGQ